MTGLLLFVYYILHFTSSLEERNGNGKCRDRSIPLLTRSRNGSPRSMIAELGAYRRMRRYNTVAISLSKRLDGVAWARSTSPSITIDQDPMDPCPSPSKS